MRLFASVIDERSREVPVLAGGRAATVLRLAMWGLGFALLAAWILLAAAHADDRYNVGWVEGTRMALARMAGSGQLFPPLYDGSHYGGTRFMPVPILLHAGVAGLTGEYLVSGKLVAYASAALLLGLMFLLFRRMELPVPVALGLTAGALATRPGVFAATTVQGDALPVALQLGAVASIAAVKERAWTVGAALLCVLAVASKLSAVWAPMAIVVWLLVRDRRRLLLFVSALLPMLVGAFALLYLVTSGRIVENLVALSFAGVEGPSALLGSPLRALVLALDGAPALVVLAPFALFLEPLLARSGVSVFYVALLCALLVLLVVLSDEGAGQNHLLDVTVLTFVVMGRVWSLVAQRRAGARAEMVLAFVVVWTIAVSALVIVRPDLRPAAASLLHGGASAASQEAELARLVPPGGTLLAEDPYVPVSLAREPVVLDPWVLRRLGQSHPRWMGDLVARIRDGEFDRILLVYPISFRAWYREIHLGPTVAAAIRDAYRFDGRRADYYVYVPDAATDNAGDGP